MNLSEMNLIQFLLIFGQIFMLFLLDPIHDGAGGLAPVDAGIPLLE